MHTRCFRKDDTEPVVSLWQECGLVRPWNDPYKDIERKLGEQAELFLVVEDNENVVATGMCGYDGHRGWVYYLAVAPSYRRRGIAKSLMASFEEQLTKKGCPKIQLMVREDNGEVIDFYRSMGYEESSVKVLGKRLIDDENTHAHLRNCANSA